MTTGTRVPQEALDQQQQRLTAQAARAEPFTQEDLYMLALADIWEAQQQEGTKAPATNSRGNWGIKKTLASNPMDDGRNIRDIERIEHRSGANRSWTS